MNSPSRRDFLAAAGSLTGLLLMPQTLRALTSFPPSPTFVDTDLDLAKILRDLPQAAPHIPRLQAASEKYASIFPIPSILPAKLLAIESAYNPDAVSASYAVGTAQFMHPTARELGAVIPPAASFQAQDDALAMRNRYQSKMNDAVAAFRKGDDTAARTLRTESDTLKARFEKLHEATMADFTKRMMTLTPEARRALDSRFDPAVSDDMIVHYLATLARLIKRDLDVLDESYILLLAAVAYNAGPGNVKRKLGIPVVAQNVEYANKLMVFQHLKL